MSYNKLLWCFVAAQTLAASFFVSHAARALDLNSNLLFTPQSGFVDLGQAGSTTSNGDYLTGTAFGQLTGLIYFGNGSPVDGQAYANAGGETGVNVNPDNTLSGFAFSIQLGLLDFSHPQVPADQQARINPNNGKLLGFAFNRMLGLIDLSLINPDIELLARGKNVPQGNLEEPVNLGATPNGKTPLELIFTILNTGITDLNLLGTPLVNLSGPNAGDFTLSTSPENASIAPGDETSFTINFQPTADGLRTATVDIGSSDPDQATFQFVITGFGIGRSLDSDNDGLSDLGEYELAPLGFDYLVGGPAQEDLVEGFISNAKNYGLFNRTEVTAARDQSFSSGQESVISAPNNFNLYRTDQIRSLYTDTPLIQIDSTTGEFLLTFGLSKSKDLEDYTPYALQQSGLSINVDGEIEYRFTEDDATAFFRLSIK